MKYELLKRIETFLDGMTSWYAYNRDDANELASTIECWKKVAANLRREIQELDVK